MRAPKASQVGAGAGAHVVLGVDVGGGAELARELDHVAAADLEVAALVDAAAERVDRRSARPGRAWRRGAPSGRGIIPARAQAQRWLSRDAAQARPTADAGGAHEGRPYWLWLPDVAAAVARDGDPPRRRLAQGEPRRLRPRLRRRRAGRRSPTTSAGTATSADEMAPGGARRRRRGWRASSPAATGSTPTRVCVARLEHGRLHGDPRRRDLRRDRRRDRDLPGGRGAPAARAARRTTSRSAPVERARADAGGLARRARPRATRSSCSARKPLILLHAEGDERIPSELVGGALRARGRAAQADRRCPGGHHRSVQHDAELQGVALRWLERDAAAAGSESVRPPGRAGRRWRCRRCRRPCRRGRGCRARRRRR